VVQFGSRIGRRGFGSIYLSVCLSVSLQRNSKTNDLKVFKLGIGNDFGIS